jgi:hypothetical protein
MSPSTFLRSIAAALVIVALAIIPSADAQPGPKKGKGGGDSLDDLVSKMMVFNKAKDGKLTKAELIDTRLHGLFERADTKKNGYITRDDLEALFNRERLDGGGFAPPKKK